MTQSLKAFLALVLIVSIFPAVMVWVPGWIVPVTTTVWYIRLIAPLLAGLSLAGLLWAGTRRDLVPDFLRQISTRYFERDGFCFAPVVMTKAGRCEVHLYFQNRYERPATAKVLLRPARGLFGRPKGLPEITLSVEAEEAAFGRCIVEWPIPAKLAGKTISVEVAAGAAYPGGRGQMLRFREGQRAGSLSENWKSGLQIVSLLAGHYVSGENPKIKITLPKGVATEVDPSIGSCTETLWKLGDTFAMEGGEQSQEADAPTPLRAESGAPALTLRKLSRT